MAQGKRSDWQLVGTVGVDAGMVWLGDPCYVLGSDSSHGPKTWQDFIDKLDFKQRVQAPLGDDIGLAVCSGYGDGSYPVYVRRLPDGTIAELRVKFA